MRISFNWLKEYLNLNTTPEIVASALTSIGLEVESMEYLGSKYAGFVIGKVVSKQKHPNADKLSVCMVAVSKKTAPLQIVCGAPNVIEGQKVIIGLPGAVVPKNQHDPDSKPLSLSNAVIRGIESNGMICSEFELGIGEDKAGIKVVENNVNIGTSLASYLGVDDVAFELGITPNRPDALSHIGVARDLAALYKKTLKLPRKYFSPSKSYAIDNYITVVVENKKDCPRYSVRMITDVEVGESPDWLKKYLSAAGLRPINNIVDVTNFVMLEYGQPLHAFDFDTIADKKIIVKNASKGEIFTTLDGKAHTLTGTELMICDGKTSIAIAGVMGGLNSEISSTTKTVILESAYFNPSSIRKTSKKLGISTDASYRFERGTDPNIVEKASSRAALLIAKVSGGKVFSGMKDVYPNEILPKKIILRTHKVSEILGVSISPKTCKKILSSLGIKLSNGKTKDTFDCFIPTYRPDIEQEIDLVEEIGRIFGFDNIPNELSGSVVFSIPSKSEKQYNTVRNWFETNGFNEIITNSLFGNDEHSKNGTAVIQVQNPLSQDHVVLRSSLLQTMLQSISYNLNHGAERIQVFEIGKTFLKSTSGLAAEFVEGIYEQNTLGICMAGVAFPVHWSEKSRKVDIFDIKGVIESILRQLGIDNIHLIWYDGPSSLTEMTMGIEINGTYVGSIGRCKKSVLNGFKIEEEVFYADVNLDILFKIETHKTHRGFSKYPTVKRDIAFIMKNEIPVGRVDETIRKAGGALVTDVILFDVYVGNNLGAGQKSLAFSLHLNSPEKTLQEDEIESILTNVIQSVTSTFEASLRSN
ncbi:MAG: phenylalanine--tRNA ligase subunit beta [Bacteroidota bacterium]